MKKPEQKPTILLPLKAVCLIEEVMAGLEANGMKPVKTEVEIEGFILVQITHNPRPDSGKIAAAMKALQATKEKREPVEPHYFKLSEMLGG